MSRQNKQRIKAAKARDFSELRKIRRAAKARQKARDEAMRKVLDSANGDDPVA